MSVDTLQDDDHNESVEPGKQGADVDCGMQIRVREAPYASL